MYVSIETCYLVLYTFVLVAVVVIIGNNESFFLLKWSFSIHCTAQYQYIVINFFVYDKYMVALQLMDNLLLLLQQ